MWTWCLSRPPRLQTVQRPAISTLFSLFSKFSQHIRFKMSSLIRSALPISSPPFGWPQKVSVHIRSTITAYVRATGPSSHLRFDHPNVITCRIRMVLIKSFSLASCHFLSLRSQYSAECHIMLFALKIMQMVLISERREHVRWELYVRHLQHVDTDYKRNTATDDGCPFHYMH